jgi:hypothetical protein
MKYCEKMLLYLLVSFENPITPEAIPICPGAIL